MTYFHYDTSGQLIAETDANGETLREYVYLDGMPIATVARSSTSATTLAIEPTVSHAWQTVTFPNQGATPVIIAGPPTYHGRDPGVIRLRHVTANSAQVAFKEWNYLDGGHTTEQVSLLALTPGRYTLSDGSIWKVGRFSLNGTRKWTSIKFNQSFSQTPRVFLTAQTANGNDVVTVRAKAVTTNGFKAALFEQDSKNGSGHTAETVGYLAIVSPTGGGAVALAGKPVNYTVSSTVVYGNFKGVAGHSIKLEEEKSKDVETGHTGETVAVLTVDGHIFAQDTTSIGRDTVAIRRNSATPASSLTTTTGTYFIHADHLGTPQVLTDDVQDTVWRAEYTPFGQASITAQAIEFNLMFPGQYYDQETGLHYNYFREYDPSTGRYITSDPVGLEGGLNTYLYAEGNALRYVDPFGLWVKRCSRKLGDRDQPATNQRFYNLLRHDYLNVSGRIFSFQRGSNMAWSQGRIDQNENQDKGCRMICDDVKFDRYVFDAVNEIGAPTYCVIAYSGNLPHLLGARNCQTWVDDVLTLAKKKYLEKEKCPRCFK